MSRDRATYDRSEMVFDSQEFRLPIKSSHTKLDPILAVKEQVIFVTSFSPAHYHTIRLLHPAAESDLCGAIVVP